VSSTSGSRALIPDRPDTVAYCRFWFSTTTLKAEDWYAAETFWYAAPRADCAVVAVAAVSAAVSVGSR